LIILEVLLIYTNNLLLYTFSEDMSRSDGLETPLLRKDHTIKEVIFRVKGIRCASCVGSIESVVSKIEGVESVSVSPLQGQTVVRYQPDLAKVCQINSL
jgi:copper chaperone CopZ